MKIIAFVFLMSFSFSLMAQTGTGGCCPWGRSRTKVAKTGPISKSKTKIIKQYKDNLKSCTGKTNIFKNLQHFDQLFLDFQKRIVESIDTSEFKAPGQSKICGENDKEKEKVKSVAEQKVSVLEMTACLFKGAEEEVSSLIDNPETRNYLKIAEGFEENEIDEAMVIFKSIKASFEIKKKTQE